MVKTKSPIDLLTSAASFAFERKIPLTDPALMGVYFDAEAQRLQGALDNTELMRGKEAENLFAATVTSLGRVRMLKPEDCGPFMGSETMTAPDFRVVLESGENWLIEVKHVYCSNPSKQRKTFTKEYARRLLAYAKATGTELRMAIYWSRWNIWTVFDPAKFLTRGGGLDITMSKAAMENEFESLGDLMIGTLAPLRLVFDNDSAYANSITNEGLADCRIGSVSFHAGEKVITDEPGRNLVFLMMMYGGWTVEGPQSVMDGDRFLGLEFFAAPEDHPGRKEKMHIIGSTSRLFSNYFLSETRKEGEIMQLNALPQPEWFSHLPLWYSGTGKKSDLPLWIFHQRPSSEPDPEDAAA